MRRTLLAFASLASSIFLVGVAGAQQQPPPPATNAPPPQGSPPPGSYAQPYPPGAYGQPPPPNYYPYGTPPPTYYAPPPQQPQPPPKDEPKHWYGWEDIPGIGVSIGLFFLARGAESTDSRVILYTSAFLVGAVWNPAVHAFNDGSRKKVKDSFSLTTAGLAVGALVGVIVAASEKSETNPDPDYGGHTLNGMEIGLCAASAIDLLLFAWTEGKRDEGDEAWVRPHVGFDGKRSFAGVVGVF